MFMVILIGEKVSEIILSLSGGLDSTMLLLHLIHKGYDIHTISYYYGQKNKVELDGHSYFTLS